MIGQAFHTQFEMESRFSRGNPFPTPTPGQVLLQQRNADLSGSTQFTRSEGRSDFRQASFLLDEIDENALVFRVFSPVLFITGDQPFQVRLIVQTSLQFAGDQLIVMAAQHAVSRPRKSNRLDHVSDMAYEVPSEY